MEKTQKMAELEHKLGKSIDEIVEDILQSMRMLEIKAAEEDAMMRDRLPFGYQLIIAISIVALLAIHYGGLL